MTPLEKIHPSATGLGRYVEPGALVLGLPPQKQITYKFYPLGRGFQPDKRPQRAIYPCPHCGRPCDERFYPDVDDGPAFFVDCEYCYITWEMDPDLAEPEARP